MRPDEVAIVIVGDTAEILDQVTDYAESLEIFDADGNQLDPSKFAVDEDAPDVDLKGDWDLFVEAQGQRLPIELELSRDDSGEYSGKMSSMLGEGDVANVEIKGNRYEIKVEAHFQGQALEVGLKGIVDGNDTSGTVVIPMMPEPLPFTGSKK